MKIAILHEMLVKLWGAEKVVKKLLDIFPEADLYTLIYDEKKVGEVFPKKYGKGKEIRTPWAPQFIYEVLKNQRFCLPFMAKAVESLDFSKYDVLLISSSAFAHGALTKPETKTIIYYHSPARYLWDWTNEYKKDIGWERWWKWWILWKLFMSLREWDFIASQRGSFALANSQNVRARIHKYYRKDAQVLYPPVEIDRFQSDIPKKTFEALEKKYKITSKSYFIILWALTEFKKVDIALKGFQELKELSLVIIGDGPLKKKYEEQTKNNKNIVFTGSLYWAELVAMVQNAKALIFPGEEDFWIVPIEAMGAGIPVFAYKAGGLQESVIEGVTWMFFSHKEGKDFSRLLKDFNLKIDAKKFESETIKNHARQFDEKKFEQEIRNLIWGEEI